MTTDVGTRSRCELTDLEPSSCSHCRAQATETRWFTASYDGVCSHPACHLPIEPGQRIHQTPSGEYEHAGCAKRNR